MRDLVDFEVVLMICSECKHERPDFQCTGWYLAFTEWHGHRFCVIQFGLDPAMARESGVAALCGENCAVKAFSKYMRARKLVMV